ncbi:MAG: large conductance mechanosensitive channel protein MscL [Pyrinomonadaceae bacterium]
MLKEFRDFIERGNVIDLAVALIMAVAFGKVITLLVEGIIMPPIGLILGRVDFDSLFYMLDTSKGVPVSLADAKTKGIPVIAYGAFINGIIAFVIVAFVVFLIVKAINKRRREKAPLVKDCPYCLSSIPSAATKCSGCNSQLTAA